VALLHAGPSWQRAVIVLSAVPVTIAMNSLRIGMTGVLVHHYGIEQALGFIHFFEGWVVFMVCTAVLWGVSTMLGRLGGPGAGAALAAIDSRAILAPLSALPGLRANPALAAACLMVLVSALALQTGEERQPEPVDRESLALFPMQLGDWRGWPQQLDPATAGVLGADDHLAARFTGEAGQVDLLLTFHRSLAGGKGGVHSPAICLPAGGWEVSQWTRETVEMPAGASPITVNRAVIQKGLQRQLVYYWFEQRGERTASEYALKFHALFDALATGRSDGGMVRLVTPFERTEDIAAAEARLAEIVRRLAPILPRYFPHRA
jgi:exosortase D (VPLPA-CTERM-specific)